MKGTKSVTGPGITSTDASIGFAVSCTANGFEPMIFAVRYDFEGNAIMMPGVDGVNDAPAVVVDIPTPEPSTGKLALAIAGSLRSASITPGDKRDSEMLTG